MRSIKIARRLSSTASLIAFAALAAPTAALAQDDEQPPVTGQTDEGTAAQQPDGENVVVVTGSRIARPALASPNPITSVDQEAIQLSGETNLVDYLQEIPALVGSLDSTQTSGSAGFIGSTGLNLLNLRNLGTQRTLILVDGRRHVAQLPETAAVDISTIPQDLIERIDVATGGVSAVYGADAVSGVVNFIMRRDFEGLVARAQIGVAGDGGDPLNGTVSVAAGTNFADGRGNIAFAYQYTRDGRLRGRDRSYLRGTNYCLIEQNNMDDPDDPNVPDQIPYCGLQFFDSTRAGAIDVDFDFVPDFNPDGRPFNLGEFVPPFYSVNGDGTFRSDYIGDLLAATDRHVANVFLNYEVSPALRLFGEVKFATSDSFSESQPTFDFTLYQTVDNPFLPAVIRDQVIPGIGADLENFFGLPAGSIPDGVAVSRDNFDLGVRAEDIHRETWRGVVGVAGEVTSGINFEASFVYGQSDVENLARNNRFNDRFFAAVDVVVDPATGQPTCRSNLDPAALRAYPTYNFFSGFGFPATLSFTPGPNSGCRPLNLFGEGVADPAAIDWVFTDSLSTSRITQAVANAFVSGSVPGLELPGGPIGFVLGAEYRRETSESTPATEDTLGQTFGNQLFPTEGDFDVKEAFAELRLPILEQQPFFWELEANAAARISDYSTVGQTFTYNAGLRWAPVRDLSFRGTYARTVRAPNIGELFSPQSQTFEFITDPCDINNINNGSQFRQANCATILNALGFDPTTFTDPNSSSVAGLQRGNTNLSEETAESWTVGAVFRPRFLPGLSITVDWYDITISDAINTAAAEEVVELCVDQPTIDNVFCDSVGRNPNTGGINNFVVQPENVANFRTAGLDFDVNYRFDPETIGIENMGTFNFRLIGNYLDELTFISTPGADLDDDRGEIRAPEYQATLDITWVRGPLTVNYGFNYFSETLRFSNADIAGDPDLASPENITFDERRTHDVQIAYDIIPERFRLYAGVNNIGDQKPDFATAYPVNPIGRFFYLGVRADLGALNPF